MIRVIGILIPFLLISIWSAFGEQQTLEPFGQIYLYPPAKQPASNLLIVISGDGGWVRAVVDFAEVMSRGNSFVVGINVKRYLKRLEKQSTDCSSPATDLKILERFVREKYGIQPEIRPILIGYSSGATLAYATFVQAQRDDFLAGFGFGFCPDLAINKPLCKVNGLEWDPGPNKKSVLFRPATKLHYPWIVFQGVIDQVCNARATRAFTEQIPSGEFVLLPKVGHGYQKLENWLPQFREILLRFQNK